MIVNLITLSSLVAPLLLMAFCFRCLISILIQYSNSITKPHCQIRMPYVTSKYCHFQMVELIKFVKSSIDSFHYRRLCDIMCTMAVNVLDQCCFPIHVTDSTARGNITIVPRQCYDHSDYFAGHEAILRLPCASEVIRRIESVPVKQPRRKWFNRKQEFWIHRKRC